jgi:hypothetical protein
MRNALNPPIMRAALACEVARELRSRCAETRLHAQYARAGSERALATARASRPAYSDAA